MAENKTRKDTWLKNYEIPRVGYFLLSAWSEWGVDYGQQVFFGRKHLIRFFHHMSGLDLVGGYYRKSEIRKVIDESIKIIFKDPDFVKKNHKKTYKFNEKYFEYAKEILRTDFRLKSDKQIADLLKKFTDIHEFAHVHSIITTWFVDSDGQDLTNKLLAILEKYVKKENSKIKVSEVFSLLTTPVQISLLTQEEIESLNLLKLILSDKSASQAIRELSDFNSIPPQIDAKLKVKMEKHLKKWQWIPFAYLGPAYKIEHYLRLWRQQILDGVDPQKEIYTRQRKPNEIKREKLRIKKVLNIGAIDSKVFDVTADIIFLKNYRKDCSFHGFYTLDKIYAEIGRRKYLSINQLQVMTYLEIINMMKSGRDADLSIVNDRLKNDSVLLHENGLLKVLSGKEAKAFLEKEDADIEKETIDVLAKEFKGVCACSGKASGPIKIINTPEEMGKMDVGDIMLSHTTFPSLVPAMKKAAAIITEDGGVTCHAAIVARELNTPCVTGIKLLTRIFKDGDMVEVDANTGVVRIIK